MHRILFLSLLVLGLAGLAFAADAIRDDDLGLVHADVTASPDPIVASPAGGDPGENARLEPYFEGIPPLIPHRIDDFLPITRSDNACIDCHAQPEAMGEEPEDGEPTPLPASHYTDLRSSPDRVDDEVESARWVCVQCHASLTDAAALVGNRYHR